MRNGITPHARVIWGTNTGNGGFVQMTAAAARHAARRVRWPDNLPAEDAPWMAWELVRTRTRYERDAGGQWVRLPSALFRERVGDCKSTAIAIGARRPPPVGRWSCGSSGIGTGRTCPMCTPWWTACRWIRCCRSGWRLYIRTRWTSLSHERTPFVPRHARRSVRTIRGTPVVALVLWHRLDRRCRPYGTSTVPCATRGRTHRREIGRSARGGRNDGP